MATVLQADKRFIGRRQELAALDAVLDAVKAQRPRWVVVSGEPGIGKTRLATYAARRLHTMADNLARLLAVEIMAAAQGVELRRPLRSSEPLERAVAAVREVCLFLDDDRPLGAEIEAVAGMVLAGRFRPN